MSGARIVCIVDGPAAALAPKLRATGAEVRADAAMLGAPRAAWPEGSTVVDLRPGDPAEAKRLAKTLAERRIGFVDAPLHCEHLDRFPADAAFLCGGSPQALDSVVPLLERLGAKVVVCGDIGAGQVARAIVGALAVCNRLITLEGAGMGFRNGLAMSDMGRVLERCSGSNGATARVLPAIAEGRRTADMRLTQAAADLSLCVQLARRVGAPALIATQAFNQVHSASRTEGTDATLDDLRRVVEGGSGFRFNP